MNDTLDKLNNARAAAVGNFMIQEDMEFVHMWLAHFAALAAQKMIKEGASADAAVTRISMNIGVELKVLGHPNAVGQIALNRLKQQKDEDDEKAKSEN